MRYTQLLARVYNRPHLILPEKLEALALWEAELERLALAGKASAKVVRLDARRPA